MGPEDASMPLMWRYVVVYLLGVLALLGGLIAVLWISDSRALWWLAGAALAAWLVGYHPVLLWCQVRATRALIAALRDGRLAAQLPPGRVREAIAELVSTHANVPGFIAAWMVDRVVTDAVAAEIVRRLQEHAGRG
jgi:hypothetical protein